MITTLTLPHPVSANRYWRVYRNRVIRSPEANDYRRAVIRAATRARIVPTDRPVIVRMTYHPRMNKNGSADKRRLDVTNTVKVAEDALQGLAYHDDKQVVSCTGRLGKPMAGGGLTVRIKTIEEGV